MLFPFRDVKKKEYTHIYKKENGAFVLSGLVTSFLAGNLGNAASHAVVTQQQTL